MKNGASYIRRGRTESRESVTKKEGRCGQMKGHGEKLTRKQEQALPLCSLLEPSEMRRSLAVSLTLLCGAGCSSRTSRRNTGRARRHVVESAVSELQAAASDAVAALRRNLTCENPAGEIRAAQIVIEQAIKGVELVDLQERIERLEGLLHEDRGTSQGFGAKRRASERTIDDIGVTIKYRCNNFGNICRVVFEIGILHNHNCARR